MATYPLSLLGGFGFVSGTLATTNQGEDVLTLEHDTDVDDASPIAVFEKVTLTDGVATRFVGWMSESPRPTTPASESRIYTIRGPQRWLERTTYKQDTVLSNDAATELQFRERGTSLVVLSQRLTGNDADGYSLEKSTLRDQLADVLDYCLDQVGSKFTYSLTNIPTNLSLPEDVQRDRSCWTVLRGLLSAVPSLSTWWDYSTSLPTLRFSRVTAAATRSLNEAANILLQATPTPRYDLLRDRVEVIYLTETMLEGAPVAQPIAEIAGPSGDAAALGADCTITQTIELRNGGCGPAEELPVGLAAEYLAWVSKLHVDCPFAADGLNWTWRAGELWDFSGAFNNLHGRTSVAHTLQRDLFAETTSVRLGVPAHLGISESWQLASYARRRGREQGPCRNNGRPPNTPPTGSPLQPVRVPGETKAIVLAGFVGTQHTEDVEFNLSGEGFFWAEATCNSQGVLTALEIHEGSSVPNPDDNTGILPLGHYVVVGETVTIDSAHTRGNVGYSRCRDNFSDPPAYNHSFPGA